MTDLQRDEVLCIPKRRQLLHDRRRAPDGQEILHIFYGDKEIVFDESELVPLGDKLLQVASFRAEDAMSWSSGAPHAWETIRDLLQALLDQDVLKRVGEESAAAPAVRSFPATLGLAPAGREPCTFSAHADRCPEITKNEYGRAVDLANLETVVPVYRVAHPALDRDGRQVGENNAFIFPTLFLDLPTQRRVCNYAGNRYQAETPMNVTALKHMMSRWPELLSLTAQFRTAFLRRLPPRGATLSVGELHMMTVCSLAAVGYVMVRGKDPVPNGELDAGLAAMFRLIDGVRLVTTELLRLSASAHGCDEPVTATRISEYAEREGMYHGVYGVCAGPQALIEEYLRVLVTGDAAPVEAEPSVAARLGDVDAALDYGLLGLRIEAMIRLFGSAQGLLHDRLRAQLHGGEPRVAIQDLLDAPIDRDHYQFFREEHSLVENFLLEIDVSRWMMARAAEGLTPSLVTADELLALDPLTQVASRERLAQFIARVLPAAAAVSPVVGDEIAAVAVDVFALERRCLRAVSAEQKQLNERLQRPAGSALTGEDLALYYGPRSGPPFRSTLAEGLGVTVSTSTDSTVVSCGHLHLSLAD